MAPRSRNPARTAQPTQGADRAPAEAGSPAGTLRPWQWFVLAAAIPLILSSSKLDLDLWHDEVYTIEAFVSRGVATIVTDYTVPNNHVLYSLVLRPFYLLSDSNFVLRLPSLACTAAALAIVFLLARRWAGLPAALLGTWLLGSNQMFLVHTMQIRGYALSMFLSAWLGWLMLAAGEVLSWRRTALIVLAGAAFLYVLPTNLLFLVPTAAVACMLAWFRGEARARAALLEGANWLAAGALAALLYLPIADRILSARAEDVGVSWGGAWNVHADFFASAAYDMVPLLPLPAIGLACWGFAWARGRRGTGEVLLLWGLALVAGSFLLTAVLGITPFVRNYSPLLPPLAAATGWLLAQLCEAVRGRLAPRCPPELAATLMVLLVGMVVVPRLVSYPARLDEYRKGQFAQGGYYNYYAARYHPARVAAYLQDQLQDQIVDDRPYYIAYDDHDHMNLWYYLARCSVPPYRQLGRSPAGTEAVVYAIVPPVPDYPAIEAKCGLAPGTVRRFPLVEEFGYYRLLRSPGPVRIRVAGVHRR